MARRVKDNHEHLLAALQGMKTQVLQEQFLYS